MANSYFIEKNMITFVTGYNPKFIADVKEVPGRRWNPDDKTWNCPINQTTAPLILTLIKRYFPVLGEDKIAELFETFMQFDLETMLEKNKPIIKQELIQRQFPFPPREYQIDHVNYMLTAKNCLNASDMGTGKTFTSIYAIEIANLFPCLVIVPASVKYNWEMQWKKMNPERSISVIENNSSSFEADVLILTYDSIGKRDAEDKKKINLKYSQLVKLGFKSALLDEAQAIKNGKTVRSKSIRKITKNIEYVFLMTGTPVMNKPIELVNLLTTMKVFNRMFGTWQNFIVRYCDAKETRFGIDYSGASNLLELHEKLKNDCYFSVRKRDVLKDLPPRQETIFYVEIDNRKQYKAAEDNLIDYISKNKGAIAAYSAMSAEQLVLINTLKIITGQGKQEQIIEWLDNFLESTDEKIIVFGMFNELLKALQNHYKCDLIYGSVSPKDRQKIIDGFQTNNKRILFLNIMAGSTGIDGLQHIASTVLFLELPWRYTDIEQAISRLERDGQKKNISINYILGKDTIDEKLFNLVLGKKIITDAVNAGEETTQTKHMKEIISCYL